MFETNQFIELRKLAAFFTVANEVIPYDSKRIDLKAASGLLAEGLSLTTKLINEDPDKEVFLHQFGATGFRNLSSLLKLHPDIPADHLAGPIQFLLPELISSIRKSNSLSALEIKQHKKQIKQEKIKETAAELFRPKINQKLLQKITQIATSVGIGLEYIALLKELNVSVFFSTPSKAFPLSWGGIYKPAERSIVLNTNRSLPIMAEILIHEIRHAWQHHVLPELYNRLSPADCIVTHKLKEIDSATSQRAWKFCYRSLNLSCEFPEFNSFSHAEQTKISALVLNIHESPHKKAALYQLEFMNALQEDVIDWNYYEKEYDFKSTFDKAGPNLRKEIQSSQFLKPDFLKKLCVTMTGEDYLPAEKDSVRKIKWSVLKMHDPVLRAALRNGPVS